MLRSLLFLTLASAAALAPAFAADARQEASLPSSGVIRTASANLEGWARTPPWQAADAGQRDPLADREPEHVRLVFNDQRPLTPLQFDDPDQDATR